MKVMVNEESIEGFVNHNTAGHTNRQHVNCISRKCCMPACDSSLAFHVLSLAQNESFVFASHIRDCLRSNSQFFLQHLKQFLAVYDISVN